MSSNIWTRCAGASELRALRLVPWRVIEAQHQVSTRKLVDSAEEQDLLERLLDRAQPPDATRGTVHYLLATPFRYPPLPHGSRFATRQERGLWYGSETRATAFAEVAYYRFVFLEGSHADLGVVPTQLSAFTVRAHTGRGINLAAPPFDRFTALIASPITYAEAQTLGAAMREAGVELFRYPSARDPDRGINVGAFSPSVFGTSKPRKFETWHCTATRARVELAMRDYFRRERYVFARDAFVVDGRLPAPAI